MTPKIIRKRELQAIYGIRPSSLYNWMANAGFPKPMKLGPKAVGWRVDEVERWLAERNPGRDPLPQAPTIH